MKKYFSLIITFFFLALFIAYVVYNLGDFKALQEFPLPAAALIVFLKIGLMITNAMFLKIILTVFNVKISGKHSFFILIFTTIGNHFTPIRGGAGFRAIYLRKKFNLPFSQFISTLSGNYIIVILVYSFIALLSLIWIHLARGLHSPSLYVFIAGLFTFCLFISLIRIKTRRLEIQSNFKLLNKAGTALKQTIDGWNGILTRRRLVIKLFLTVVFGFLFIFFITLVEFKFITAQTSIPSLMLYSALSNLSLFISITPGAIGIRESLFLIFQNLMNLTTGDVLNIAVIDRGLVFVTLALLYLSTKVFRYDRS